MKAICKNFNIVELKDVQFTEKASNEHLIIKMESVGINLGDFIFIKGMFPKGFSPDSLYDICGVSGAGKVIEIGENVPKEYMGKNVCVYKSLIFSNNIIGTWSEYSQMHYLSTVILPDNINLEEYSASLVNSITPYAFLKQIKKEGHKGIIATAGNSATGRAMLGICIAYDIPIISIVRNEASKCELEKLNAKNVLIESSDDFEKKLEEKANEMKTTAVFDGVGGKLISKVANVLPMNSTIYSYGFLGGNESLSIHTSKILMKGMQIKGFGNFTSETVKDLNKLEIALKDLSKIIDMPHFKTKIGKKFPLKDFEKALNFHSKNGEKAIFNI